MNKKDYYLKGVLPVALSSLVWGSNLFFRKIVITEIDPLLLNFVTSAMAALCLMVFYRLGPWKLTVAFRKDPIRNLAVALTGTALGSSFMFISLKHLDLGVASLLEETQPVFILILGLIFLKERFRISTLPYILLALLSAYLITFRNPLSLDLTNLKFWGLLTGLLAALSWGAATIIGKSLTNGKCKASEISTLRMLLASIMLLPIFLFYQKLGLTLNFSTELAWILVISSILKAAGFLFFYRGLTIISASTCGFLEMLRPIFSVMMGLLFLGETFTLPQTLAIPLLFLAVYKISDHNQGVT